MTASAAIVPGSEPDLIVRREGAAGIIRLNRPRAINALTLEMTRGIVTALDDFEVDQKVSLILRGGVLDGGFFAVARMQPRERGLITRVLFRKSEIIG